MRRWMVALGCVLLSTTMAACKNSDYCDQEKPCTDPVLSYCDIAGEYGTGNQCIEPPWDAGTGPDAEVDAWQPECQQSSECTAPTAPICSAEGECAACEQDGTGDTDCAARDSAAPRCADDGSCVECLSATDCTAAATEPVCDPDSNTCRGCQSHDECASEVCDMDSGACVAEGDIVYVATGGTDGASCGSSASPCKTIGGAQGGLAKVTVSRKTVHVASGLYGESVSITAGQTVIVVGPEATVSPSAGSNTPAFLINNGSHATLDGLTLANATGGTDADGIRCESSSSATVINATVQDNKGTGIESSGCTVSIERSTLSNNDGGGVSITGSPFTLRNNFITANGVAGGTGSLFGGVNIQNSGSISPQILEFNTVADSKAQSGAPSVGVYCLVSTPMTASNNLVYLTTGGQATVAGNCTWTYSDIQDDTTGGTGNLDADPDFVDSNNGNFHLKSTSPCKNTADPAATLTVDFDGDARPQGGRSDIGADEVVEE